MDVTKHYITIDVGASSGRIIVYSFDKEIKSHEVHRFKNKPYSEKNHLLWSFTHIMNEIYEGLTKAFQYESEISAIGIDSWGCDYGYIDFTGKLIQNPYSYRDLRTANIESITNKYFSRESLYKKTGIQHLRFNTIYQIVDDLINHKEILSKANKLLMIPDLIAYHLTGIIKMELTNLSTTSFYDSINHEIIDEVNKLGYPSSLIPEVIKPGEFYGNILPHIAQKYNLKEVPVIAVCTHDTASAVHSLQLSKTDTYISSGTWSLIGKLLDKPLINNNTFKKSYTNEIGFNNKIRFLKNISGFWIKNLILEAFNQVKVEYDELDRLIEQTLDFDSIIDLDHNDFEVGENIVEKIQTHCRKTNQKVPHKLEEFISVFNYSLVCKYRQHIETLDNLTDYKTNQIFIIGGGASNSLINQMTADITGIKVIEGNNEATSLGNAFVLHQAINQIEDVTVKSLFINNEKKEFLPKKDLTEVYKKYIKLMKGTCL
jgi:sugar (pentulose or hexulose) kinase